MKITHSIETLQAALAAIRNLDAAEIVGDFLEFKHSCPPGTYCAAVLDPTSGDVHHVNEASWSCSTDEYFGESGVLSRTTLLSSTREHWSPGPEDGFEWEDGDDYVHPKKDYAGWITAAAFADLDEDEQEKYTEWFSVSETPVNGWLDNADHFISDVENQLSELAERIEEEIAEAEEEEEEEAEEEEEIEE